jgi:hypothetical protein
MLQPPRERDCLVRPNGFELSCPAAQTTAHPFSHNLAGQSSFKLPHASRVSCSELLGGPKASRSCGKELDDLAVLNSYDL